MSRDRQYETARFWGKQQHLKKATGKIHEVILHGVQFPDHIFILENGIPFIGKSKIVFLLEKIFFYESKIIANENDNVKKYKFNKILNKSN